MELRGKVINISRFQDSSFIMIFEIVALIFFCIFTIFDIVRRSLMNFYMSLDKNYYQCQSLRGEEMLYSRRNLGIDLIKIIACIQVVMLHNFAKYFDGTLNTINFVKTFTELIYFGGSTAIPLFFMANGYFVLNKSKLNFYYWVKKSKSILKIVFAWIFLYSLKDLISIHKPDLFTKICKIPIKHMHHAFDGYFAFSPFKCTKRASALV